MIFLRFDRERRNFPLTTRDRCSSHLFSRIALKSSSCCSMFPKILLEVSVKSFWLVLQHKKLHRRDTWETFVETALVDYGSLLHSIFIDILILCYHFDSFSETFFTFIPRGGEEVLSRGFAQPLMSLGVMEGGRKKLKSHDIDCMRISKWLNSKRSSLSLLNE